MAVTPINAASATAPNWLKEAQESLVAAANPGGLLGTLQDSRGRVGTIKSFLRQSQNAAAGLALVSQGAANSVFEFTMKLASEAVNKRVTERLEANLAYNKKQTNYTPPQQLDRFIYFNDGGSVDTENNIWTKADGTQIDTLTGQKYIEPGTIMQLANGSYLDTKNNILTLADGTRIDTVTHLVITT